MQVRHGVQAILWLASHLEYFVVVFLLAFAWLVRVTVQWRRTRKRRFRRLRRELGSREAAEDCSAERKPWVGGKERKSPGRAKDISNFLSPFQGFLVLAAHPGLAL